MDKKLSVTGESFQPPHPAVAVFHGYENLPQEFRYSWYWNRKAIENCSPSRADGIDLAKETQLRMLYCSFIQDIGMMLRVPQVTIATAMMFCHRFYLHQSHAKNEWQTIATVCMFLASKVEDTPCHLNKVVKIAYETMYQRDYVAAQRINKTEVFEKQKSLILLAERLVLCTIGYDFSVRHPYKPVIEGLRKLKIDNKNVRQTAWNFVNDWLRTTICLQFEPNYIAAGSIFLSARHHNVKLPPGDNGCTWWQVLNIVPKIFDAVLRQMKEVLSCKQKQVPKLPPKLAKQTETHAVAVVKQETVLSPDSCVSTEDVTLAPKSTTSSGKLGNSAGLNGTHKNSVEDVTSVPEPTASNAKLSPTDHFETESSQGSGEDQCEKENSEGLNGTATNRMDHVSSDPVLPTSNAKLNGNSVCLNGTVKNCIEDVSLVPESTTSSAELSKKNQRETRSSEGFSGTVENCMDGMASIPESTTSNAETSTKIQSETQNSEDLNGNCTVKTCLDDMPSIPESITSNAETGTKIQSETQNSEDLNGNCTVKTCLDGMASIPESTTSNAETGTKIQSETQNSEDLNGNCMEEDMPSLPEPVISTPEVNTENHCGTKKSNRADGTVNCGLENGVPNALRNLLDMDKIRSLMKRRKRNRSTSDRVISLECLNDDELIERELESGIVLAKRPKPCKNLVSL